MKKIILFLLIFVFMINNRVYANSEFKVVLGNKTKTVTAVNVEIDNRVLETKFSAYTIDGRTFVPIREISENLGASVDWDNKTKSATIKSDNKTIKLKIDSSVVYINGKKTKIENISVPKFAKYSSPNEETKTMVPLRFLSETFGYKVDWDGKNQIASVQTEEYVSKDLVKESSDKKDTKSKDTKTNNTKSNDKKNNSKEDIKVESLSNSEKNSKPISKTAKKNTDGFVSNFEKNETNKLGKLNKDAAYEAAGLNVDEIQPEIERTITKTIKKDGKVTIVIDPGHGGKDSGAIVSSGLTEKELNLKVAKKLYDMLSTTDYEVIITRNTDEFIKLVDRAGIANDNNAEIFLSIHFNSSENREAKGIEVLYASENKVMIKTVEQKHLANELLKALLKETGSNSRGIKNRPDLVVLNKTKNVAALAELGFMSNPEDYDNLINDEYLDKLAKGLYDGLSNYINKYVVE